MLSTADKGSEQSILAWCEYVLKGILAEISKINKLTDYGYLSKRVLRPAVDLCDERGLLEKHEAEVLKIGIRKQSFKQSDLDESFKEMTSRQKSHLLSKMKNKKLISPFKEGGREYHINFTNNILMRGLVIVLYMEGFIPSIDR